MSLLCSRGFLSDFDVLKASCRHLYFMTPVFLHIWLGEVSDLLAGTSSLMPLILLAGTTMRGAISLTGGTPKLSMHSNSELNVSLINMMNLVYRHQMEVLSMLMEN